MAEPELNEILEKWRKRAHDPRFGHGYVRFAEHLLNAGDAGEALAVLEKGLDKGSICHGALLQLGIALLAKGRDIEARSHLLRLLAQDPENVKALALLADHAREAGRGEEARRFYLRLIEVDPVNAKWKESLQSVGRQLGTSSTPGAELASFAGQRPMSTMTLVEIYLAQGYRDQALAVLREMAAADASRTDILQRIAEIEEGFSRGLARLEEATRSTFPTSENVRDGRPDSERLAFVRKQAAERRATEKMQFQSWVKNLNRGTEQ